MKDTSPEVAAIYRRLLLARRPEERLLMACSMHETARQLALEALRAQALGADETELAWRLFLRFYGDDLSEAVKDGFRAALFARRTVAEPT